MRVLLVEDDRALADGLLASLRALGIAADGFGDGASADSALSVVPYDAIVLDLGLPGGDGLEWLARWRATGLTVPVLILTARDAIDSRIGGLDGGADDYLIKPLAVGELAARLRAVVRRTHGRPEPVWMHGDLAYRPDSKSATWWGVPVELRA